MPGPADTASFVLRSAADARLATLAVDDFTPFLGQLFRLAHDGGVVELVLRRADPACIRAREARRAGFSLEFLGPPAPCLTQRIYPLEHPQLGVLELFLVPLGYEQNGVRYEVVFG